MSAKIQPGNYEAKIVDYGIGNTKAGDPQAMVLFEFNDQDGDRHEITWYGSFKPKAQEWTMKALLTCGFRGNDPMDLADGVTANILDANTPVRLVVEQETRDDGKVYSKVAWINAAGGALAKKLTKSEAKIKMGALNLKAAMMAAREATGIKDQPRETLPKTGTDSQDDIPW